MSQEHNGRPVLYRITTSPHGKGRLEGTAEAVARSDSLMSAVFKEIKGRARLERPKARHSSRLWQEISEKAK